MKDFIKYLATGSKEENWGFYVSTVGYTRTDPNQRYPSVKNHPKNHVFNWNNGRILNDYYIIFISRGEGLFESALAGTQKVTAGTCFFLFPGVWHRYKPNPRSGWEEYWVGFNGSFPRQLMGMNNFQPQNPFINVGYNRELLYNFQKLVETVRMASIGYQQVIPGLVYQILGMLNCFSYYKEQNTQIDKIVAEAKFLMQEAIDKATDIQDIIKGLPVSYSKFRKTFAEKTGASPNQYLLELRLQRAKELLKTTTLQIKEIATQTGFDSAYYFSKFFKKRNGTSPKSYRSGTA